LDNILSVFDLNEYVRKSLASNPFLRGIQIRGEISGFKSYPSGHWYFSLKDENARISCVMFKHHRLPAQAPPTDGLRVILSGSVSLYTKDGHYQFYAEQMREDGKGELFARFLLLKDRLTAEGVFDASIKRPVPLYPLCVGIATSAAGAAIHDMITVARRRNSGVPLVLCPVKVQGEGSAEEIVLAIEKLNRVKDVEVIIIGRGGGSIEDLWSFNDERIAYAIRASRVPVISAVGHETDFTISDFAADVRAATPSQAAEICIPDRNELKLKIARSADWLHASALAVLQAYHARLSNLHVRLVRANPGVQLIRSINASRDLENRLRMAMNERMNAFRERYTVLSSALKALSPAAVLDRGYTLIYDRSSVISDIGRLHPGMEVKLQMKNGSADVAVLNTMRE